MIGKLTDQQYQLCDDDIRCIGEILRQEMLERDDDLIDFKVEFGVDAGGNVRLPVFYLNIWGHIIGRVQYRQTTIFSRIPLHRRGWSLG